MGDYARLADLLLTSDLDTALRLLDRTVGVFNVPSSIEVDTGGTPVGDVTDLQTLLDGNVYNLPETATTPGFDLQVDFTKVPRISAIVLRSYYGPKTSTHYSQLKIHNYTTDSDDVIIDFQPADDHNYRTILIPSDKDYISDGNVQLRFYHPPAGNPAHGLFVDYIALVT